MEISDVKDWLAHARGINQEIAALKRSAANLQARAASVPACGHKPNRAAEGARRYAGLVAECVGELEVHAAAVAAVIESVPDETQRRVLECKYIRGLTNEEIADATSYCTGSVNRYHRAALLAVKNILERQEESETE